MSSLGARHVANDPPFGLHLGLALGVAVLVSRTEVESAAVCLDGDSQLGDREVGTSDESTACIEDAELTDHARQVFQRSFDQNLEG